VTIVKTNEINTNHGVDSAGGSLSVVVSEFVSEFGSEFVSEFGSEFSSGVGSVSGSGFGSGSF